MPVLVAPTGLNGILRPRGDEQLARAAVAAGTRFILSTAANATIEEVVRASTKPPWFQLYIVERELALQHIARAKAAECPVLMLTVDVPVGGRRLRDLKSGLSFPLKFTPRIVADSISRPIWAAQQLRARGWSAAMPLTGDDSADAGRKQRLLSRKFDSSLVWDDVARIRDIWKGPLVLKGILDVQDAETAAGVGVDGIVVSNHGGRQLDAAPASLSVLPEIASAVRGKARVLLDSGVRCGDDVIRALALGADAVLVGRPMLYGLAARGERGARAVLELFRSELSTSMALAGFSDPAEISHRCLVANGGRGASIEAASGRPDHKPEGSCR